MTRGASPLIIIGRRTRFIKYYAETLRRRQFISALSKAQLSATFGRDRLGTAWLTLTPLLNALTYYLIFGVVLDTRAGIDDFIGFLLIGVFLFQYSSGTIMEGAQVIRKNYRLVQTLNFPRAVLPASTIFKNLYAFLPALGVMLLLVLAIPPHAGLSPTWLVLIPALLLQTLFNAGLVLILARIVSSVNDISNVLQFTVRTWMYFSGLFYSFDRYASSPQLLSILELNPMHAFLTIVRDGVLYGEISSVSVWLTASVWSLALCGIGLIAFWRGEESYARI